MNNKEIQKIVKAVESPFSRLAKKEKEIMGRLSQQTKAIGKITRPFKELEKIASPSREVLKSLNRTMEPLAEIQRAVRNQIAPFENITKTWAQQFNDLTSRITPWVVQFQNHLEEVITERKAEYLIELSHKGWFIDPPALDALIQFLTNTENETIEQVEAELVRHFGSRLDGIEANLIASHPHRQHIISPAISAHRNKEYVLSIPTFLTQVDGICVELTGHEYFIDKERKKIEKHFDEVVTELYNEIFLKPLKESTPVTAHKGTRRKKKIFTHLNRHMVLHGESLDYGTQTYSLQALSLLNYVAEVFGSAVAERKNLLQPEKQS